MGRPSREELKKILIECLEREEGEAAPDRLLCAYRALKGLTKRELLELAEECEEVEVIRERYYPYDDREIIIFLRLKGYGKGETITPRDRRAEANNPLPDW